MSIVRSFKEFFATSYKDDVFKILEMYPKEKSLIVDFKDLEIFDPNLADLLIERSSDVLKEAKKALKNSDPLLKNTDINVRFKNVTHIVPLKEINSNYIGEYVGFYGIIRSIEQVYPVLSKSLFECKSCMRLYEVKQKSTDSIVEPSLCEECGGKSFKLLQKESQYQDTQKLIVGHSDTSFLLEVVLKDDLCSYDDFKVGQYKLFYGTIVSIYQKKGKFKLYLECNYIEDVEHAVVDDFKDINDSVEGRNSKDYGRWRDEVINRDKFCQCCGGHKYLEAHHIFSWEDYPSLRFDVENGVSLCKWCHHKYNSYFGHKGTGANLINFLRMFGINKKTP